MSETERLLAMVEILAAQREQISQLQNELKRLRYTWGEMPYPSDISIAEHEAEDRVRAELLPSESGGQDG